jgi:nucleotide-binding universal stress UspA family protein
MFKTILLATDGSAHAERAAKVAANLAVTYDATLVIMTVSPSSLSLDDLASVPQAKHFSKSVRNDIEKMRDIIDNVAMSDDVMYTSIPVPQSAIKAIAEEILRSVERSAKDKKVKNIVRINVVGNPARELLKQAGKSKVDLIVMGTRGLSDIGGLVLGSVSHKVIHLAKCPCLTVK